MCVCLKLIEFFFFFALDVSMSDYYITVSPTVSFKEKKLDGKTVS